MHVPCRRQKSGRSLERSPHTAMRHDGGFTPDTTWQARPPFPLLSTPSCPSHQSGRYRPWGGIGRWRMLTAIGPPHWVRCCSAIRSVLVALARRRITSPRTRLQLGPRSGCYPSPHPFVQRSRSCCGSPCLQRSPVVQGHTECPPSQSPLVIQLNFPPSS